MLGHFDARPVFDGGNRKAMNCQLHSDEALKFYCTTCSCLVCCDCVILSHSGHSYDRIKATAEKEKGDLLAVTARSTSTNTVSGFDEP